MPWRQRSLAWHRGQAPKVGSQSADGERDGEFIVRDETVGEESEVGPI